MWVNSWGAERLVTSQEGLGSVKLIIIRVVKSNMLRYIHTKL